MNEKFETLINKVITNLENSRNKKCSPVSLITFILEVNGEVNDDFLKEFMRLYKGTPNQIDDKYAETASDSEAWYNNRIVWMKEWRKKL
jgi:hypothetical protein